MGREGREGEIVTSTCWLLMSSCCGTLTTDWSLYSAVRSVDHWTSGRTKTNAVGDNTEAPLAPRPSTPYTTWGQQPQWGGESTRRALYWTYLFLFILDGTIQMHKSRDFSDMWSSVNISRHCCLRYGAREMTSMFYFFISFPQNIISWERDSISFPRNSYFVGTKYYRDCYFVLLKYYFVGTK